MVLYNCEICNYTTKIKTHFERHLKTKRHLKKEENYHNESVKYTISPQNTTKYHTNTTHIPQNTTKYHKIPHKNVEISENKKFECEFCNKLFSRIDSLNRHIQKYCKKGSLHENEEFLKLEIEEHKAEKEKLYKYIDKLIDKTGDTNITIDKQMNNQIKLNNFGEENLSHITDDYKLKMLSLPYGMIQNMIEKVHFNNKFPENKNIALTNKRDNMIRVFRGKKWRYQDRNYVVDEIIKNNYNRLDEYFEEVGKDKMNFIHNKRYLRFQKKFDTNDEVLMDKIKKETEMIILSENLQKQN